MSSGPLSSHWTLTAASADGRFPIILEPKPVTPVSSTDSVEDPYYRQAAAAVSATQFALDDNTPTLMLKLRRRRKQNMSVDTGRDARAEDERLKTILSAAHSQASKSKKAFGKLISNLAHTKDDEMEDGRKVCLKTAEGDAQSSHKGYFHFVGASPNPTRPTKMRRSKSELERKVRVQISSPFLPSLATLGHSPFVRRERALPLRPSPTPNLYQSFNR